MKDDCSFERCRARAKHGEPPCDKHCPRSLDAVVCIIVALFVLYAVIACVM